MTKRFLAFSGFSGAMAVALGAMGAHYLKQLLEAGYITSANLQAFETGVKYQIYHTIALLIIGLLSEKFNSKTLQKAGFCFMIGIVLFSGSLYLLSTASLIGLTKTHWLGPITPIGGLFFIIGWILLGLSGIGKANS